MKVAKFKQFTFTLLAVFSLFASSISACVCEHHQEKSKLETPSCHGHSNQTEAENHNNASEFKDSQFTISEADCRCIQPAPKVSFKSETVKIEKQIRTILPLISANLVSTQPEKTLAFEFPKPLYLSDSFYNLSSGRAPPRL